MRVVLVCAAMAALAGCANRADPVVDRMGVDDARYRADLAACRQSSGGGLFSFSNPVAGCLQSKGYRVLMGR